MQMVRGDAHKLPRVVTITIIAISIYNFGWGFADSYFSIYLAEFSAHYSTIGVFKFIISLVGALLLIPVGELMERTDNIAATSKAKYVYGLIGLGYFLAGEFSSIPILIASLVLNGAMLPFVWVGTISTLRSHATKKTAGLVSGFYITGTQIAFAAGLLLGIFLLADLPIHYMFILVAVMSVLSGLFGRNAHDSHHEPLIRSLRDLIVKDRVMGRWWKDARQFNPEVWASLLLMFLTYAIPLVSLTFLPLFGKEIGLSFTQIGLLVVVMNIPFLFSFIASEIADRAERLRTVIVGLGISAIAISMLAIWHSEPWHLYAGAFFFSMGYAFMIPSLDTIVTVLTPQKQSGTVSASTQLVLYISAMALAPIMGLLIDRYGWTELFMLLGMYLGALVVLVATLQFRFRKRNISYHLSHKASRHNPYIL